MLAGDPSLICSQSSISVRQLEKSSRGRTGLNDSNGLGPGRLPEVSKYGAQQASLSSETLLLRTDPLPLLQIWLMLMIADTGLAVQRLRLPRAWQVCVRIGRRASVPARVLCAACTPKAHIKGEGSTGDRGGFASHSSSLERHPPPSPALFLLQRRPDEAPPSPPLRRRTLPSPTVDRASPARLCGRPRITQRSDLSCRFVCLPTLQLCGPSRFPTDVRSSGCQIRICLRSRSSTARSTALCVTHALPSCFVRAADNRTPLGLLVSLHLRNLHA